MMDEPDLMATPRLAPKAMLKRDTVREAELLLLPERVVRLNAPGAAILRLCDGNVTISQMVVQLERDFQATGLVHDVVAFLEDARGKGWVVIS